MLIVRAGPGIVGDRYVNRRAHANAAITVMAADASAGRPGIGLRQTRRNILLGGVDVDTAQPRWVLVLDSGHGAVRLEIRRPANPCR